MRVRATLLMSFQPELGVQSGCNNPIVERVCKRQRQSSPANASLVFLHQQVGKYYLSR